MADETKIHTINLTDAWNAPYKKRSKKAICFIQEFVKRHTGAKTAKTAMKLNEAIWARGAKNPPRTVRVQIIRENDNVYWAELEGVKFELPKKPEAKAKANEEKKEEPKAEEKKEAPKAEAKPGEEKTEDATKPAKEKKPEDKKAEKPKAEPATKKAAVKKQPEKTEKKDELSI